MFKSSTVNLGSLHSMLKNQYFEYLDLPQIPKEIVDEIINNDGRDVSFIHKYDKYKVYYPSTKLTQWVQENINQKYDKIRIQEIIDSLPPHTDPGRTSALNYIIKTGDGVTSFYQPKPNYLYKTGFADINNLDEVYKIKIEPNRWHRISTKTIHGVSGINSNRLALTLHVV